MAIKVREQVTIKVANSDFDLMDLVFLVRETFFDLHFAAVTFGNLFSFDSTQFLPLQAYCWSLCYCLLY